MRRAPAQPATAPYSVGESLPSIALRTILMGGNPCFKKVIVKFLQRKLAAAHLFVVFAQLQNLQLPQRVIKISRIGSAALGLDHAHFVRLVAFLSKKSMA